MSRIMKIEWHNIKESASEIFNIWVDSPELKWAEDAWSKLDLEGLTSYTNELDKHIVLIRFLALGTLYYEFCQFAFEEMSNIDYYSWAKALDSEDLFLSLFRLGQLLGSSYMPVEEIYDSSAEQSLLPDFIGSLVEQQRAIVVAALVKSFGSASLLFAHLWLSPNTLDHENEDDDKDGGIYYRSNTVETVENVLASAAFEKMAAFEWVMDDMPAIQGYSYPKLHSTIEDLIEAGESETVEFKQGLCLNPHTMKKDESMVVNVLKTVAAFMNTDGGHLLIGVADNGSIIGVEQEYPVVNSKKCNRDGFQLYLSDLLTSRIDNGLNHLLQKVTFHLVDGKNICKVDVKKSRDYAYFDCKVYIRQGNRSIEIKGKQLIEHTRNIDSGAG
jgi:Putative DNA-binding domain